MFTKIFNIDEKTDTRIKRLLGLGAGIAMLTSGIVGVNKIWDTHLDPLVASHADVVDIINATPLARKDDVAHIMNSMVDEQIGDAKEEIESIEDKEDANKASKEEIRKKLRLEKDIIKYKKNYIPEQHHDHEHQD